MLWRFLRDYTKHDKWGQVVPLSSAKSWFVKACPETNRSLSVASNVRTTGRGLLLFLGNSDIFERYNQTINMHTTASRSGQVMTKSRFRLRISFWRNKDYSGRRGKNRKNRRGKNWRKLAIFLRCNSNMANFRKFLFGRAAAINSLSDYL